MDTANFFHSVTLDRDKCHGCINCVKRRPTEAIRVRGGKAKIIKERCIDCGEACIFKLREEIDSMAESLRRLSRVMPTADGDKTRREDSP